MKKSYIVDSTCNDMRLDRWIRLKIGKIPQGLVEKYLRTGKIKLNKKKVKSSFKIKTKDEINIFNIKFKETILQKKIKFSPTKEIMTFITPTIASVDMLRVLLEKNLSKFNFLDDNRDIDDAHVAMLVVSIQRYGQLMPIVVN